MKILFSGSMGRFPLGGHAWATMQFLAGLKDLGHEVVYFEECGEESWVYNWETDELVTDLAYPTDYVRACLEPIGMDRDWIYRAGERAAGMTESDFKDYCAEADLMVVRAVPLAKWRPEYELPRRHVFIDVDPGFTQVRLLRGDEDLGATVTRCDRLFTIGQRLDRDDCRIPAAGYEWSKTVSPVWLPGWPVAESESTDFSLILQWESYTKSHRYGNLTYDGVRYGQKDEEFDTYLDLPSLTGRKFRMALTGGPRDRLIERGWNVVEGWKATQTPSLYQRFIGESRAELGIAKHGYVMSRGGWFSDRSACYLASGRPVVVQDTGLEDWIPTGEGVLAFSDLDGARRGIEEIESDYARHRVAARCIAEDYFSTDRVLSALLEEAIG